MPAIVRANEVAGVEQQTSEGGGLADLFLRGIRHYAAVHRADEKLPEVSAADRRAATDRFFSAVGLDENAALDRTQLTSILKNYYALDATQGSPRARKRAAELSARIEGSLAEQGPLPGFIARIKNDLVERHTPISRFLALADLDALSSKPEVAAIANKVAHHAYALEAIVQLMVKDQEFSKELRRHFYHQRSEKGITLGRIAELAGTFGAVKAATIDMVFRPVLGLVVGLERTRKWDKVLPPDRWAWGNSGVPLNITEAMVTEAMKGAYDNALAGYRLAVRPPKSASMGREHRELLLSYPKGWAELYESWNLLFVLSNLEKPEFLIAKLLIPSVTSADEENYIYRRTLALWTTIQSYLFLRDRGAPSAELKLDPQQAAELQALWGRINREYSETLLAQDHGPKKKTRKLLTTP